jgi:hypothetical protein
MGSSLLRAIEEFITNRMDDHGTEAPGEIADAITNAGHCQDKLRESLSREQEKLFWEMEDALSLQTGEETRYYYLAGFCDAVRILLKLNDGD